MTNILDKIKNYDKLERDLQNQIMENGAKERENQRLRKQNKEYEQRHYEMLELLKEKDLEISKLKATKKKGRPKKVDKDE